MATTGGGQDEWDQFHARNTQQKRSHHPSDSPLDHSDTDSQDSHGNAPAAQPDTNIPWTGPRDVIPNRNFGYSTGPKGIIHDARTQRHGGSNSISPSRTGPQRNERIQPYIDNLRDGHPRQARRSSSSDSSSDAVFRELETDNTAAAERYDAARRTEMHRNHRLQDVSGPAFEGMIAAADARVVVVGFIYDDHPEIWHRLEFCIQSVARRCGGLRCVKLHYEEAKFERGSAPAIVAFRDAEEVAHVLNVYEEVSVDDLNVDAVEGLFQRYHII